MKYPPAPLTPFLASPPDNSHPLQINPSPIAFVGRNSNTAVSYSYKLLVVAKKVNSFAIKQIQTLSQKHRGGGGVFLCDTSAFSASLRYHLRSSRQSLFARAYELLASPHRFASHSFSLTYKSLFSQLPCFQKHLRCPLVFPNPTRSDPNSRLSTVDWRLP